MSTKHLQDLMQWCSHDVWGLTGIREECHVYFDPEDGLFHAYIFVNRQKVTAADEDLETALEGLHIAVGRLIVMLTAELQALDEEFKNGAVNQ